MSKLLDVLLEDNDVTLITTQPYRSTPVVNESDDVSRIIIDVPLRKYKDVKLLSELRKL